MHSGLYCSGNLALNFGRFWCKNRPFYYCKHGENWSSEDPHCSLLICSLKWAQVKYKRLGYISLSPFAVFSCYLTCQMQKMAKKRVVFVFRHYEWQKTTQNDQIESILNHSAPFYKKLWWCSGYHIWFTCGRSQVRASAGTFVHIF